MQLRDHPAITSKRDFYMVDPRKIVVDPLYNVRHLDTPEAMDKLSELQRDIAANGVKVPLEIRMDDHDQIVLVAGHRRLRATLAAIEAGSEIVAVPVIPEAKHTGEAERVLALHTSNTGEPLQPLERAEIVRRLINFGWSEADIARRMGYKTAQPVSDLLQLLGAPEEVKEMVRNGEVSATTATRVVKKERSTAGATLKAAKAAGGKKKATAKGLNKVKGKTELTEVQITRLVKFAQYVAKTYSGELASKAEEALKGIE